MTDNCSEAGADILKQNHDTQVANGAEIELMDASQLSRRYMVHTVQMNNDDLFCLGSRG